MSNVPYFSIIIPTYRRAGTLDALLHDLSMQDRNPPFEVVVCNEESDPKTAAVLARYTETFPLRILSSAERLNSCVSRNWCMAEASGLYLLFLDDDVRLEKTFLEAAMKSSRQFEAFSCMIRARKASRFSVAWLIALIWPGRIFPFFGYFSGGFTIPFSRPRRVSHLPGCMMVFRRSLCDGILFDPAVGIGNGYLDDADFSYAVKRRTGTSLWYVPRFSLVHLQAPSGGNREHDMGKWHEYYIRHKLYFFAKHGKSAYLPLIIFFSAIETALRSIWWKRNLFPAYYKAIT